MAAANEVLCCVVAVLVVIGIHDVLTNFENNRCAMSYMWETPEYIPVPILNESVQQKYPRYALTLYGEGRYAKEIKKMKLSGIPVLFIPGNAGSHKQVRSLSSIALRKASKYRFHFNYFSVDLNEELNGIYGGVLEGQTEYVHACIQHILGLYSNNKDPPKQVVIIGHSKGGLVAKALFARPDFDSGTVNTLITMGTPHVTAVVKPDAYMDQFTTGVNRFWSDNWNSTKLGDVTVLSIGGGYRDNMVRSGLASMDGMIAPDRGLSVVVGSVPRVWLSTDHRCIVWCKELVLATNRALFDLVDRLKGQISTNPEYRTHVLRHHFVSHDGRQSYSPHAENAVGFADGNFKTITTGFHHVAGSHSKQAVHYVFPIDPDDPAQDAFSVTMTTTTTSEEGWLFVCTRSHEERCVEGVDITRRARLMPPLKAGAREAHLDLKNLGVDSPKLIAVKIPRSNKIHVTVDVYKRSGRTINASLPGFFSYKPETIMQQHDSHSLFFNVSLPDLNAVWKAYTATLEPLECFEPIRKDGNTTLRLHVPWYQEDEWSVVTATEANTIPLRLQSGRPDGDDRPAQLHAYVHSRCHYRLQVSFSHREMLGQMARFYGYLLPCFVVDVALLAVSYMLAHVASKKPLQSLIPTMAAHCKPYMVVPFASLAQALLPHIHKPLSEATSFAVLDQQHINFALLPILLFIFGYGVVTILAAVMEVDVMFFGRLLSLFKGTGLTLDQPRSKGSLGFSLLLYSIMGALAAVCVGSCGAIVLLLLTVLYLVKVIALQARVDVLRSCLNVSPSGHGREKGQGSDGDPKTGAESRDDGAAAPSPPSLQDMANSSLYFHFSLMMLTLLLTLLNLPSLAVWVKNMRHEEYNLERDPALYPTLVVIASLSVLLDPAYTLPKNGVLTRSVSWLIHAVTIAAVLFGMDAMYRLSYFIATTVLLAAINQATSS